MGTSLPETAVSVTASIAGNNALAVSNAVGSNIFNLMVVIGFCAVMTPVVVQKDTLKRDFPISIGCAVLLLILGAIGPMTLGRIDGAIFIVLFAVFIVVMVRSALRASKEAKAAAVEAAGEGEGIKVISMPKSIIFIIGGSIGLGKEVLAKSNYALSFSKMTFPHQLMRVILLEQIYRSYRIIHGEPYHK